MPPPENNGSNVAQSDVRRKSKDWTSIEALEFALEDIKSGKIAPGALTVLIEHQLNPGEVSSPIQPISYSSDMVTSEFLAMLEMHKVLALQEWMGPLWAGPRRS